jgi:hypothetical protein
VVQRRDARDELERGGLERATEEVAAHELNLGGDVLAAGCLDADTVQVDAHDVRHLTD